MGTLKEQITWVILLGAIVIGSTACGSLATLAEDSSTGTEASTTTESTTEEATATSTSKNVTDGEGDWTDGDGNSVTGLAVGDIRGMTAEMDDEEIEVFVTMGDTIPTGLDSELLFYTIDFVIYDPDRATRTTGFLADVSEQASLSAYGSSDAGLSPSHSSTQGITITAKSFFVGGSSYEDTGVSATQDASDNIAFDTDGTAARFTIPLSLLKYERAELCDLEVGAIAQTFTADGHIIDKTDRMQFTEGSCAQYSRTRCWDDAACTALISAQLVSKDQCKAIGGKGWGPNSSDCTAL